MIEYLPMIYLWNDRALSIVNSMIWELMSIKEEFLETERAVSVLSPVTIQTLIPDCLKNSNVSWTPSCNLSSKKIAPNNENSFSYSIHMSNNLSLSLYFFKFDFFK